MFKVSKIILCTGAGTAKLVADSAPNYLWDTGFGRIVAAAFFSGIVKIAPVWIQRVAKKILCGISSPYSATKYR